MAIFGRNAARRRLRRATPDSLAIPAFSSPVDCTPWVIGGLWPAELSTTDSQTATAADYLKSDLQRIVDSANAELRRIRRVAMDEPVRRAEETRVINAARSFAVRRVESTVRNVHGLPPQPSGRRRRPGVDQGQRTTAAPRFKVAAAARVDAPADVSGEASQPAARHRRPEQTVSEDVAPPAVDVSSGHARFAPEPDQVQSETAQPLEPSHPGEDDEATEVFPLPAVAPETGDQDGTEVLAPEPEAGGDAEVEPPATPVPDPVIVTADDTDVAGRSAAELILPEHPVSSYEPHAEPETDRERLQRLLQFVARQEPGIRWAVGVAEDATTIVVTDLAHGWIPSGITLPAEVRLLKPQRRTGGTTALLGPTKLSATYAPGDPLGWATDFGLTESSLQPRELPPIEDLGWLLGEATHWRDGLPRIAHTLAKAGAAGTGVAEAELDVLRVHLDTARYQLLAQYPDVDPALLLNCLLLAGTESIATGDLVSANYHFDWFRALSAPPPSRFSAAT